MNDNRLTVLFVTLMAALIGLALYVAWVMMVVDVASRITAP